MFSIISAFTLYLFLSPSLFKQITAILEVPSLLLMMFPCKSSRSQLSVLPRRWLEEDVAVFLTKLSTVPVDIIDVVAWTAMLWISVVDMDMGQNLIEGTLEVKLPTIWTDEKQSRAEAERRERLKEKRSEKRKSQKKEDADARKGTKVAKHYVFPMI